MKKLFLFTLVFFSSQIIMAQKMEEKVVRVIYEFKYQPNKQDTLKRTEDMVLFRSKSKSIFQSYFMYQKDSLLFNEEKLGNSPMNVYGKLKFIPNFKHNYVIEKKFDTNKYEITDKIFSDKYRYAEDITKFEWKPTNKTLKIGNLNCRSATTKFAGRDYIAWYTEDIPIPDGPYKFFGLPGLIVKISDSQNQFDFSLKSVKEIPEIVMIEGNSNKKVIETTRDKFLQAKKTFQENAINDLKNRGITFEDESEVNKFLKEKFKKDNNPIEIE